MDIKYRVMGMGIEYRMDTLLTNLVYLQTLFTRTSENRAPFFVSEATIHVSI
jgi:hypothetical protein